MSEPEILKQVLLECTEGRRNKFYELTLWFLGDTEKGYAIESRWGSRKDNWKYDSSVGSHKRLRHAKYQRTLDKFFDDQIRSKTNRSNQPYRKVDKSKPKKVESATPTIEEASLERFGAMANEI